MLLSYRRDSDGFSYNPKSFAGIGPSLPLTGSLVGLTPVMALEDRTTPRTPDICAVRPDLRQPLYSALLTLAFV